MKRRIPPAVLAAGAILLLAMFCAVPAAVTLVQSFRTSVQFADLSSGRWVGLEGYRALFSDENFPIVMRNTLLAALCSSVFLAALACPAAIGLSRIPNVAARFALAAIPILVFLVPQAVSLMGLGEALDVWGGQARLGWLFVAWMRAVYALPFVLLALLLLDVVRPIRAKGQIAFCLLLSLAFGWYGAFAGSASVSDVFKSTFFAGGVTLPSFRLRAAGGDASMLFPSLAATMIVAGALAKAGAALAAGGMLSLRRAKLRGDARTPLWLAALGIVPAAAALALTLLPILRMQSVWADVRDGYDFSGEYAATLIYLLVPLTGVALGGCLAAMLRRKREIPLSACAAVCILLLSVASMSLGRYHIRAALGLHQTMLPGMEVGSAAAAGFLAVALLSGTWKHQGNPLRRALLFCGGLTLLMYVLVASDGMYTGTYNWMAEHINIAGLEHYAINRADFLEGMFGKLLPPQSIRTADVTRYVGLPGFSLLQLLFSAGGCAMMALSLRGTARNDLKQ